MKIWKNKTTLKTTYSLKVNKSKIKFETEKNKNPKNQKQLNEKQAGMDGNQNLTLSLHSLHPVTYLTCLSTPCLSTCEAHSVLQRKEWKHVSPRMAVGTKGSVVRTHQQQTGRERWIDRHRERERQRGQKTGRGRRQLTVATCGSCDTRGPDGLTDCVRAVCRSVLVTIIAHNPPPPDAPEVITWIVGVGDGGTDGVGLQGEGGRRRHSWTETENC